MPYFDPLDAAMLLVRRAPPDCILRIPLKDLTLSKPSDAQHGDRDSSDADRDLNNSSPDRSLESTQAHDQSDTVDYPGSGDLGNSRQALANVGVGTARRYRVLRAHAKGGLGEVFVARDDELQRNVALKEIQPRFADRLESRARFVLEAEITGGLEHPGIVPVYGFGQYSDGRPFYAMRFIRGKSFAESIADFHSSTEKNRSERALELRKLLGRFVDVCDAIAYAHSRGVLHRDLKPANVMLGDFGETLVVDWGLAKAASKPENTQHVRDQQELDLLQPISGSGVEATVDGSAMGTPAYMSPEQACGRLKELSTSTDIYALGAILYSVLCGQAPIQGDTINQLLEKARAGDIHAPSSILSNVPASLEAVCMKALSHDPKNRYGSARLLADDVESYLADEAVVARVDPLPTRAWRWIRKHRTVSASVAAALFVGSVALAISNTLILTEQDRTSEQRDLAVKNFQLARDSVDQYFTDVSQSVLLKTPGMQPLQRQLLEGALDYYTQFTASHQDSTDLQLEYARALTRVGKIQEILGSHEEAIEALIAARDVFAVQAQRPDSSLEIQVESANSNRLVSKAHLLNGNQYEAGRAIDLAWRKLAVLRADFPNDVSVQLSAAETDNALANLHIGRGEFETGTGVLTEAVEQCEALLARYPNDLEVKRMLAFLLSGLASSLAQQSNVEAAIDVYERATQMHEAIVARVDRHTQDVASFANTLHNYSNAMRFQGRIPEALTLANTQRDTYRTLMNENPTVLDFQLSYAQANSELGVYNGMSGEHGVALEAFQEANAILTPLAILRPTHVATQRSLATSFVNLAKENEFLGQADEALGLYKRGLDLIREISQANPDVHSVKVGLGRSLQNVALTLVRQEQFDEALPLFEEAETVRTAIVENSPLDPYSRTDLASVLHAKGNVLIDLGRRELAPALYRQAIAQDQFAVDTNVPGPFQERVLFHYEALIGILKDLDLRDDAETAIDEMVSIDTVTPDQLYNAACAHSVFAGRSAAEGPEGGVEVMNIRQAHTQSAVMLLRRAISAGWNDLEHIQQDAELDPIRSGSGFAELLKLIVDLH